MMTMGVTVKDEDRNGNTMLSAAVEGGHVELVRKLAAQGSDVNRPDSEKETPLDKAIRAENQSMITLLRSLGAVTGKSSEPRK